MSELINEKNATHRVLLLFAANYILLGWHLGVYLIVHYIRINVFPIPYIVLIMKVGN